MTMLAPDATWTADSGGKVSARPAARGRRRAGGPGHRRADAQGAVHAALRVEMVTCNSAPAVLLYLGDQLEG